MILAAHARQAGIAAALQGGVQRLVFHRQMQLDGAAHGNDALRDLGRIALHPGVGQLPQQIDAAQDVEMLVLEFVDAHGGTPGVMKRARRVVRQSARATPMGHPSIASFRPPHPAL